MYIPSPDRRGNRCDRVGHNIRETRLIEEEKEEEEEEEEEDRWPLIKSAAAMLRLKLSTPRWHGLVEGGRHPRGCDIERAAKREICRKVRVV